MESVNDCPRSCYCPRLGERVQEAHTYSGIRGTRMMQTQILMSAKDLQARLDDPGWVVADCRSDLADFDAGRRAYEQGHIPGSVFLDLDRDLAGPVTPGSGRHPLPDVDKVSFRFGQLGIGNASTIVVYDGGNGALAARAWWVLRWLGHDAVFVLDGGYGHWESQGLPVESELVNRAPATFVPQPDSSKIITTGQLAADIAVIRDRNLLDARDRARYLGEEELIDSVAGHVPGAVNLPFAQFVNKDGTWRPLDERKALLEEVLGADRQMPWCVMCGSGVTACHLAISGLEAGFREPQLYVGSWSEWIRDPARPIGTGEG